MTIKPQNLEEKIVWYTIIGTYGLYFLGLQYMGIPIIAWFLVLYLVKKLWNQTEDTPVQEKITIPAGVWIWIVFMLVMEVSLIMSHIDLDLGVVKIVKSSMGWARTWALMALCPLIGCLKIRPQLIYRAASILCLQSLAFSLVCLLWHILHIPHIPYVSPVGLISAKLGDKVQLFILEDGGIRLNLFTELANNLGLAGSVYFLLVRHESDKRLRLIATTSAVIMVVGSFSRLTIFCVVIIPILTWILTNFTWPVQIAAGVVSLLSGMFATPIIDLLKTAYDESIKDYRTASEQTRRKLKQIALYRWREYPFWGHGIVEEHGPKITDGIPIGTHNQWPDILYVKGIIGCIAFLVPLVWSFMDLLLKAQKNTDAKAGLSIILLFFIAGIGADIELPAYNYWPGLVLIGIAFKQKVPDVVTTQTKYAPI